MTTWQDDLVDQMVEIIVEVWEGDETSIEGYRDVAHKLVEKGFWLNDPENSFLQLSFPKDAGDQIWFVSPSANTMYRLDDSNDTFPALPGMSDRQAVIVKALLGYSLTQLQRRKEEEIQRDSD